MERLIVIATVIAALLTASVALAQEPACDLREEVLKVLAAEFQEVPAAVALEERGGVVELLTSNSGKTWTLIVTAPNGVSCLVGAGENWEVVPARAPGEAS